MEFGIPREVRDQEARVGLTPAGVGALVAAGHTIYVERDAGLAAGFSDEDYRRQGGKIVYSPDEAYRRAEVVVKVARPTVEEYQRFRPGQTLLSFLHLAVASPDLLEALQRVSITAMAWELVTTPDGRRPALQVMSEIAGRLAPVLAGSFLQTHHGGRGILLGGLPGVPPATVVILGAGELGTQAARAFRGLCAHVIVLDSRLAQLQTIDSHLGGGIITMQATPHALRQAVAFADVLVGAVSVPGQRTPLLVTREMVRTMRSGSVILDFAVDDGGCVETTRPTTHRDPTYAVEGVIHFAVPNVPARVARTASYALTNATLPYLLALGARGLWPALREIPDLSNGLVVREGRLVHADVARGLDREVEQ
ncbi:MAG: alanine dehydrogenase [Ardenticatenaceae bacterium]|nr:alanine dehydrogenase [Ardenticatenaceae bacterium]HBY98040.1 alanine dehydrogenase [Chloroflexota bacterium]